MELVQPASRSVSLEQSIKATSVSRPRAASDRDATRTETVNNQLEENQYPPTLPTAFQRMLKTTTETGDIGLFSIKPSRLPHSLTSPGRAGVVYNENTRKPTQSFQPYAVPCGDDRHRLPSYARDASSEVISMYETASQKSGSKGHEEPDYRSYSMTQKSCSSYDLSAYRSYAGRSPPDGLGIIQRPRSPSAYPTRLKRPGFRPSSPALTDDGVIDYRRRIGIERVPQGQNHSSSSPSSLYAQKRKPPLSLRNEANGSKPCLLGQPSPPRYPQSPSHRHSTETHCNDWQRRAFSASVKTSPARSVMSLASTANVGGVGTPLFAITTTGKVHPPSPLYYDYTEDFDVDDYSQSELRPPPPAFRIDESALEYPPLSVKKRVAAVIESKTVETSLKSYGESTPSATFISHVESRTANGKSGSSIVLGSTRNYDAVTRDCQITSGTGGSNCDTNVVRLSGLGCGARQLSSHVEEVFGLSSSPTFEINILKNGGNLAVEGDMKGDADKIQVDKELITHSTRSSSLTISIDMQRSPHISEREPDDISKSPDFMQWKNIAELNLGALESQRDLQQLESTIRIPRYVERSGDQLHQPPFAQGMHVDGNYTGQTDLINKEAKKTDKWGYNVQDLGRAQGRATSYVASLIYCPAKSASSLHSTLDHNAYHGQYSLSHVSSRTSLEKCPKQHNKDDRKPILEIKAPLCGLSSSDMPNFNYQSPTQLLSRSESPMLAPKPISPARQLKLKSSVPQLMKALPPLPPDPPIGAGLLPDHFPTTVRTKLPHRIPSSTKNNRREQKRNQDLLHESRSRGEVGHTTTLYRPEIPNEVASKSEQFDFRGKSAELASTNTRSSAHVTKLKLKSRHNTFSKQLSSSWPIDQEKRQSWSGSALDEQLVASDYIENPKTKRPKFRLKVTRASNSTQGTVRINRKSAESKPLTGLRLQNTKDLFARNSSIDSVFCRASMHLQGKMPLAESTRPSSVGAATTIPSSVIWYAAERVATNHDITSRNTRRSLRHSSNSPGAQSSFSDAGLIIKRKIKLRTRLSNLGSQIAVLYTSRVPKTQCDDIQSISTAISNDANSSPFRPLPLIRATKATRDIRPPRIKESTKRRQKMKLKIREWLREARSVIASQVKPRSYTGKSDDETTQLTTKLE